MSAMSGSRISIALCTFNGENYLKEQLDSISNQTRVPDELIVCDDASQDGTLSIIKEYAQHSKFPVQLTINIKNIGFVNNFGNAIGQCKGDIIVLCDQDDVWYPDKLENIERVFDASNIGAVFSDADIVDERLHPLGYTLWQSIRFTKREKKQVDMGKALDVTLKHNVVAGATLAFRSSYRNQILPMIQYCMHDIWIMLIISTLGEVAMINKPLIMYRQHSGQQIGGLKKNVYSAYFENPALKKMPTESVSSPKLNVKALLEVERELGIYQSLYDRVQIVGAKTKDMKMVKIKSKIDHLLARELILKKNRLLRLPLIIKELITLRYDRFSNGILYIINDLLSK